MDERAHVSVVTIPAADAAFRLTLSPRGAARLEFLPAGTHPSAALTGLAAAVAAQLEEYLAGARTEFTLPLDLSGCTAYQRRVLDACAAVPAGSVITYAELARRAGTPGAARAAGSALARNPLPVLIPCHRVIRGDGALGGFLGGLEWKRRLLKLEGVTIA